MLKIHTNAKHRLAGLVVLSAMLHLCGFYFFTQGQPENKSTAPLISAQIVFPASVKKAASRNVSEQKPELPHKKQLPVSRQREATRPQAAATQQSVAKNHNLQPSDQPADSVNWYQVQTRIRTELSEHFYYPKIAQRNGWQGRVVLSVTVNKNGSLTDHRVVETSGYNILDQAALSSLVKIRHVPLAKGQLYNSVDIQFPVLYILNRG